MNILIAGASGYLGSHLVKTLANKYNVIALIRSSSSKERLNKLPVKIVCLDECTSLEMVYITHKPNIVINTVALYGRKGESMTALLEANIVFPNKLLTLAGQYKVDAYINAGTSLPENISPYSLTKNTFVKIAECSKANDLKFINVKLEHFYGPRDNLSKFTTYVMDSCLKGKELNLTSGEQLRDFIHIVDVATAFNAIIDNINSIGSFESIDVGSGNAISIRDMVEMMHTYTNSKSVLKFGAVAMRSNELMYSCADVSRLKELGWNSKYELKEGLQEMLLEEKRLANNEAFDSD